VEETQYYPFGLAMLQVTPQATAGISSKAAGKMENRKKFNGYEVNKGLDLNWLERFLIICAYPSFTHLTI
jgi:hypothetical protein